MRCCASRSASCSSPSRSDPEVLYVHPRGHGAVLCVDWLAGAAGVLVFAAGDGGRCVAGCSTIRTRWVALGLIPVLLGALWVHIGNGWVFSNAGGGWEYPVFLVVISGVVALQAQTVRVKNSLGTVQPKLA